MSQNNTDITEQLRQRVANNSNNIEDKTRDNKRSTWFTNVVHVSVDANSNYFECW